MSAQVVLEQPLTAKGQPSIDEAQKAPKLAECFRGVVTRAEAEQLVGWDAELLDYQLRQYSEEKIGFLGSHLCLITRSRGPGGGLETRSFFVKTVPRDVPSQAAYIAEKGCFEKEAGFLELLMPRLLENYTGEPWAPRCHLVKQDTLVFEDMKLQGFANRSRFFDLRSMKAALACIARFHACSLLAEDSFKGVSLKERYPKLLRETEFLREGRCKDWYLTAMGLAVWLANELGLKTAELGRAGERVFDIVRPSATMRNVVSHGDLWSSNLLFDGSDHCRLVDFQLTRYAPLAHDVQQLLHLCATREFRARHEPELLRHYHACLEASLAASGYADPVPSYAELLRGADEQRLPALVTAMIFHPTVLMDGRTAARIMNDPDTYEAYYFRDRVPFVREIMARDPEYRKIMHDTVRELVEMSLKLDTLPRPT